MSGPDHPNLQGAALRDAVRARRIFYHDIEIADGVRTRFPEDYDEVPYLRRTDALLRETLSRIDKHAAAGFAGRTVLDAGCADGLFAFHAARRGADRVVGIERNRFNYEHACFVRDAAGLTTVAFTHGPVESLDPGERFDDVFALGLLYHLVSPLAALHVLRGVCRERLFATVPVDYDSNDRAPLARLDRYQSDGHGFWAFNTAFVSHMFETAGLEILNTHATRLHEPSGRPAALFIVARPMNAAPHHVFAPVIDQEFPPSIERRRVAVRRMWPALGKRFKRPVAIFGAGKHTGWLLDQTADLSGPTIECILDDRPVAGSRVRRLSVRRPQPVDAERFDAILISSWFQHDAIERRCRELFGDRLPIIALKSDADRADQPSHGPQASGVITPP